MLHRPQNKGAKERDHEIDSTRHAGRGISTARARVGGGFTIGTKWRQPAGCGAHNKYRHSRGRDWPARLRDPAYSHALVGCAKGQGPTDKESPKKTNERHGGRGISAT